jgi:RNA polymerase sigma factor (sigma-70 family)
METDIIARAVAGDAKALESLIRSYRPLAFRVAFAVTSDRMLAEDAAQEACLQASRDLDCLRDAASFRSWLLRIVSRQAVRAKKRRPGSAEHESTLLSAESVVSEDILDLRSALIKLPSELRVPRAAGRSGRGDAANGTFPRRPPGGSTKWCNTWFLRTGWAEKLLFQLRNAKREVGLVRSSQRNTSFARPVRKRFYARATARRCESRANVDGRRRKSHAFHRRPERAGDRQDRSRHVGAAQLARRWTSVGTSLRRMFDAGPLTRPTPRA